MRLVPRAAVLAALVACGGDGSTKPADPGPTVTTIVVSGPTGALQVGGTFALSAEVRDQSGAAIAGKTPTWTSANNSIATVSAAGVMTAAAAGSTSISAAVDGKTGSVNVTVQNPPVFAVTITPLAGPPIAGQSTPLNVVVTDRSGTTLFGSRITWSSSEPLVATVDSEGQLSATSPGTTTLTASSEGVSGSLAITVTAPEGSTPPTIESVAPATWTPGTTATIRGTGFLGASTTAAIAGVRAAVMSASSTELTVAVPASGLPCQSAEPSPIMVATVGGMATTNQMLVVARTRNLAVGESFVVAASGDIGCNALAASGSYIVSVFNGSTTLSATRRFELRGSIAGGSASRVPAGEPLTIDAAATRRSLAPSALTAVEQQHLGRLDDDLGILRRLGAPRRRSGLAPSYPGAARAPVPLTVGATTTLKFHYSSCTAAAAPSVTARVVYVG